MARLLREQPQTNRFGSGRAPAEATGESFQRAPKGMSEMSGPSSPMSMAKHVCLRVRMLFVMKAGTWDALQSMWPGTRLIPGAYDGQLR